MVVKTSFLSSPDREGAALRAFRLAVSIGRELLRVLRHRRAVHRLADLDDRALKDIGLLRSDVEGVLLEPWYRDPSRILAVRRGEPRPGSP